jgi:hypothetical protein
VQKNELMWDIKKYQIFAQNIFIVFSYLALHNFSALDCIFMRLPGIANKNRLLKFIKHLALLLKYIFTVWKLYTAKMLSLKICFHKKFSNNKFEFHWSASYSTQSHKTYLIVSVILQYFDCWFVMHINILILRTFLYIQAMDSKIWHSFNEFSNKIKCATKKTCS